MAADSFAYSDGDLATVSGGAWAYCIDSMKVASGIAQATTFGTRSAAYYVGAASSADQFSQSTAPGGSTPYLFALGLRLAGGSVGYFIFTGAGLSGEVSVLKALGPGNFVGLTGAGGNTSGAGFAAGNTLRAEISGTAIRVFIDAVEVFPASGAWTDATHASGQPGISSEYDGVYDQHDNWSGGDLGGGGGGGNPWYAFAQQ